VSDTIKIPAESFEILAMEHGSVDDLTFVDSSYAGQWRWGVRYRIVFKDSADNYWQHTYQEQIGDHFYLSFQDADTVTAKRVYPKQITTYVYEDEPGDA
jgi:hypothetical protein